MSRTNLIKKCSSDVAGGAENHHGDLLAPPFPKHNKSITSSSGAVTDTTGITFDDSFTEVTHRKGRRENK